MKHAVRTLVLVVAVYCTCLAAAAPILNAVGYAPAPICGPKENEFCK